MQQSPRDSMEVGQRERKSEREGARESEREGAENQSLTEGDTGCVASLSEEGQTDRSCSS